jgi:hypothetical protein
MVAAFNLLENLVEASLAGLAQEVQGQFHALAAA